jgi:hypothetical protein
MRQVDQSDQRPIRDTAFAKSSHEAVAALIATQTYCRIAFLPARIRWTISSTAQCFWGVCQTVTALLCPLTLFEKRRDAQTR